MTNMVADRPTTTTKSFRTTEEVRRLVARIAALRNIDEGDLLSDMLDSYLLVHSPSFAHVFPGARAVISAKPAQLNDALARFRAELAADFSGEARLPRLPSAREQLIARRGAPPTR